MPYGNTVTGVYLIFIIGFCQCGPVTKEVVGKLEIELSYSNPYHYSSSGWCDILARTCDVYFEICVTSPEIKQTNDCNVAKKTTSVIGPHSSIQLVGHELIEIPLFKGLPVNAKFRIEAWDWDGATADDLIARFVSNDIPLSSSSEFTNLNLRKVEATQYNTDVNIKASMKLTCSLHYYGQQCQTYCKPDYKSYFCGENGERKCFPGWYGEFCQKQDMCTIKPCAPYAVCSNTDDEDGRVCFCNGGSGPECYQIPNPCHSSPCHNGGICTRMGHHLEQFMCECREPWYGPTCDQRFSACEWQLREMRDSTTNQSAEVCLNGGVCQDDPDNFAYTCICSSGWRGTRCENPDHTAATVVPIVVLLIGAILIVIICLILRKRWCSEVPRPHVIISPPRQVSKAITIEDTEAISNEIYGNVPTYAGPVELLSAEDEYSILEEAQRPKPPLRKSYEGTVRYASLLWEKKPRAKTDTRLDLHETIPPLPALLLRSPLTGRDSLDTFRDRPVQSMYERSREEVSSGTLDPLPVRNSIGTFKLSRHGQ